MHPPNFLLELLIFFFKILFFLSQILNDAFRKMKINMIAYDYRSSLPVWCEKNFRAETAFLITNTPVNSSTIKHFQPNNIKSSKENMKYREEVEQFKQVRKLDEKSTADMCKKYASRFFGCKCKGVSFIEDDI